MKYFYNFLFFLIVYCVSFAVFAEEGLSDPQLEQRFQALAKQLRCPICQGQSIYSSDAPIAYDLRVLVNSQLQQGKSDQEILDFISERYGDIVLFNPPFSSRTGFLWLAPLLFLSLSFLLVWRRCISVAVPALQKKSKTP